MVSAIILSWKRPENIYKIVLELRKNKLIDDIVIWNNNLEEKFSDLDTINMVKVIKSKCNAGLHARWKACRLAKNDAIFMQDDDLIISKSAIKTLYEAWEKEPDIMHGLFGRNLNRRLEYNYVNVYGKPEIVLIGATIFYKKYALEMLKKLPSLSHNLASMTNINGEDILINYLIRSITGKRNKAYDLNSQVEKLSEDYALSKKDAHLEERTCIARLCRTEFQIYDGIVRNILARLR